MLDSAAVTAQGGRAYMEDFVRLVPFFTRHEDWLYAGVFDGHRGDGVSRLASQQMHGILAAALLEGRPVDAAMRDAFHAFDERVAAEPCGSTAAIVVLQGDALTVANAGDSHVALVSRGAVEQLTTDHRLTTEAEHRRVVAAGARIEGPYVCLRRGFGLMCTRSLGDRDFRKIGIIAEPDVSIRALGPEDEWIVLGTDGVWDGLAPEAVADLVRSAATAKAAAEGIRDSALDANTDNVSVVAIRLP